MKILFAASEALPFIASGGLADVAGALPKAIRKKNVACRVVIPLYSNIKDEYREKLKFVTSFTVKMAWRNIYCGVFSANIDGVIYYLLDNEYYFKRDGIYGFFDDAERYAFFSKAILEMIPHIKYIPDVIHSNDWQSALVPIYHNLYYSDIEGYQNIKNVFTIHNIQYQGKYGKEIMYDVLDLPEYATNIVSYDNCVNLMRGAIETADKVTTVSPTYAKEILDPWYSHGLDYLLRENQYKLSGILNGIDNDRYNPEIDCELYQNFKSGDLKGKKLEKKALLKELGLQDNGEPVISIVTRLVGHKGIDLIKFVFEDILALGTKIVVLGSGDYFYEGFFKDMQARYPDKVSVTIGFIPELAKRIYAASDIFLMPSKSEPCGLVQMISLRYGTIPIVRETGGLADSITDCGTLQGNGFTFKSYNAHDMLNAATRAKSLYDDNKNWSKLVSYAFTCDFSWKKSAGSYIDLYKDVVRVI